MLRMEIALLLVLGFVAYIYFSAERKHTPLHRTFSMLLVVVLVHLVFDSLTIYTVNHLDAVPRLLNDMLHRFFVGSMVLVPNFILQPIVENSLLHGLKNKGYRGEVRITAQKSAQRKNCMEIQVIDTGSGFAEGKKAEIDQMLLTYAKQAPKLEGNSIGILNVQKRVKLLCGREYGLRYTENEKGGVTAHLLLPVNEENVK